MTGLGGGRVRNRSRTTPDSGEKPLYTDEYASIRFSPKIVFLPFLHLPMINPLVLPRLESFTRLNRLRSPPVRKESSEMGKSQGSRRSYAGHGGRSSTNCTLFISTTWVVEQFSRYYLCAPRLHSDRPVRDTASSDLSLSVSPPQSVRDPLPPDCTTRAPSVPRPPAIGVGTTSTVFHEGPPSR